MLAEEIRGHVLPCQDRDFEKLEIPEWKVPGSDQPLTVYIYAWSEEDRGAIDEWFIKAEDNGRRSSGYRSRLALYSVCDEHGTRVFKNDDLAALETKSTVALSRIAPVAARVNKLSKEAQEELEKNSASASGDSLPSG